MAARIEALAARPSTPDLTGGEPRGKKPERPPSGFIGAVRKDDGLHIAAKNGNVHTFTIPLSTDAPATEALPSLLVSLQQIDPGTHWRTLALSGANGDGRDVAALSWINRGISTMLYEDRVVEPSDLLERMKEHHTEYGMRKIVIGPDGRVFSSRLTRVEDYKKVTPKHVWKENMGIFRNVATESDNTVFIDDNTTEKAGGVAGMNHPKQRIVDDYNAVERQKMVKGEEGHPLDYRWMKKDGRIDAAIAAKYGIDLQDPELLAQYGIDDPDNPGKQKIHIFMLTKKRHVMLQDDAEPGDVYTEKDDKLYHAWSETQYKLNLRPVLMEAKAQGKKVALKLEDQQTWGQLESLRKDFPLVDPESDFLKIIARNHIHSKAILAADPTSKQYPIAESILGDLSYGIDMFMVHRSNDTVVGRDEFVFKGPDGNAHPAIASKIVYAEASFDDLDGLGRRITDEEKPLLYAENNFNLYENGQTPDNFELPGVGIYARDDESKRKIMGMRAYAQFAQRMHADGVPIDKIPNYRDIAMGAPDDPSGDRIHWAYLIGLHPELAERAPKDITFKESDITVMQQLQEIVAETPWIANKVKKYRFTYDKYDDRNRRSIEQTCEIAGQYSSAEACEDQISRWIAGTPEKDNVYTPEDGGVYTVVSNVGGMPTQVEDGISGRIIDKTDDEKEVTAIATEFYTYFTQVYPNPEIRREFRQRVKAALKPQYTTIYNLAREFGASALATRSSDRIPEMVRQHHEETGHYPFVHDLLGEYKPKPERALPQNGILYAAN